MLIEFSVTNFRSFRDRQVFSMVGDSGAEHPKNTFDSGISAFPKLLASAALYGPNAAGKTNLLKALQFMQSVVVNSAASNPVGQLSYVPFKFDMLSRNAPSTFEVTFGDHESKTYYEYGFAIDAERVHREWLTEYKTRASRLFERIFDPSINDYKWSFGKAFRGDKAVWRNATRQNALFLSTAVQLNSSQLVPIFWWFQKRLVAVVGVSTFNLQLTLKVVDEPGGKERLLPFVREADPFIADLKVDRQPLKPGETFEQLPLWETIPNGPPNIAKVTFSHTSLNSKDPVSIDLSDESSGTQALFRTAGAWLNVFSNGEILLVDEIDTSLHPLLVKFLIERFHSEQTNSRHSQLIFTTHNTSLLNQEIFRRDQIWFVEKGPENSSRCYPLTDFSPRKDEVIERWYMRGRYGALPILTDIET